MLNCSDLNNQRKTERKVKHRAFFSLGMIFIAIGTCYAYPVATAGNDQVITTTQEQAGPDTQRVTKQTAYSTPARPRKEEYFSFPNNSLMDILRKLERWYGVKFVYEDTLVNIHYCLTGVPRSSSIETVLNHLQVLGGLTYRVKGKKIHLYRGTGRHSPLRGDSL